jgi:integrase
VSLYRRGNVWWYKFRFEGETYCESSKSASKTIAADAQRSRRRELEQTFNKIGKRTMPPTFSKAASAWLEKIKVKPATKERNKFALAHLEKMFGSMLVSDISAQGISRYQNSRLGGGAAAATINKEVVCLASILRDCGLWHHIKKTKSDVRLLDVPESPGRALDPEQEQFLFLAAAEIGRGAHRQGNWSPVYTATVLALNTGMRHLEIRGLRWSQVELDSRTLIVGKSKTDAGTGRCVPLNRAAWAALDMWASRFPGRRPEHFVFPSCENGQVNPMRSISNWRTAWRRATSLIRCPACTLLQNPGTTCDNAECKGDIRQIESSIANLRFHDLRHTAATKLLEQGVPFAVVAQIAGWKPSTAMRMVKVYGHIRPEVQRAALDKISTSGRPAASQSALPPNRSRGSYKNGYSRETVVRSVPHN